MNEEQKNNGEKEVDCNVIGGDVPDELCYQWAEEYFLNLEAKVDQTEEDAEFVPKPYKSTLTSKPKKKEIPKKDSVKKPVSNSAESTKQTQLSFAAAQQPSLLEGIV